jgi:diaminopimelate epimerase
MRLHFTKMHGAGNDFVVLDATRAPLALSREQLQFLGDRRFGVGADQILVVEAAQTPDVDFRYRIFNGATGDEVEQCGNGSRCFVRYVHDHGLSDQTTIRVETVNNRLTLSLQPDGRVTVDMNQPRFAPADLPFDPTGLTPREVNGMPLWPLDLGGAQAGVMVEVALVSMGNPHAVLRVDDVATAPVADWGPKIEAHPRFRARSTPASCRCARAPRWPARVRARRGRDPGLRHRRLRGGGGRHPPGLAGCHGGCAHPRRRADHQLGRRGPFGDDDRSRGDRL